MNSLENRNRKIIDAVIRKEQAVCPGAVALIGVYGSFMTGDVHPLSDLDLLILINDDRGWQLGRCPRNRRSPRAHTESRPRR